MAILGATSGELFKTARQVLFKGGIDTLLIELCASDKSTLTALVPHRSAAARITEKPDLTNTKTLRILQDIVRLAGKLKIKVVTWASTPCTASCPWRHVNVAMGRKTGNVVLTGELIQNAVKLCKMTKSLGGDFC